MKISDGSPIIREDLELIALYDLPWQQLQNKTILISGGSGFLASYLVKALITASDAHHLGIKIICVVRSLEGVVRRLSSFLQHKSLIVIQHDVTLPLPPDFPAADVIIHSASQASPKFYGIDPVGTLMANTVGTSNLLDHAVKHKARRFLFFSSAEVYGSLSTFSSPLDEKSYGYVDPLDVRSCYSESKRIGETMCASWSHQFSLHASVVRPFHTYGPGMALDDGRVFADFVADVVNGRDIVLKSDGLARRSFCYIADATVGFLTVLLMGKNGEAYNVANPFADISIRELAFLVSSLFPERKVDVRSEIVNANSSYLRSSASHFYPSIEKISKLGWLPVTNLEDGFRRSIESFL